MAAASREALSARQPGSSTVARRCGPEGQDENTEVSMSTKTVRRPKKTAKHDEPRSFRSGAGCATGTTTTRSGRSAASAAESPARTTTKRNARRAATAICVVCESLLENQTRTSSRRIARGQTSSGSASASRKTRRSSGPSEASRWRRSPSPPLTTEAISSANWLAKMRFI